ncbi:Cytochrome P450 71A25 [Apostasia shenzhenica]|uniref:Cytochrome P450 71A25 n=1 Tax=Apostasia shenzhenica TaxID=1088818 RepID=A0A2I0B3V8_9ASPA|nr:Cytochrome P450 71A25 [Apostasia shenzhenica]
MATFVAAIALLSFLLCLFFGLRQARSGAGQLPPSPPGLPLLGNLLQLSSLPHRSLHSLSKRYGPIFLLHLGAAPTAVLSSAELAEQVMKTLDPDFASRPPLSIADRLLYNSSGIAFSAYSEPWRQRKKTCVLHLLSSKRVQSFRWLREEEVKHLISEIRSSSPAPVNLSEKIVCLTSDVICRAAMGRKFDEESMFRKTMKEVMTLLGMFSVADFVPWLWWVDKLSGLDGRVRRAAEVLDEELSRVLQERMGRRRSEERMGRRRSEGGRRGEENEESADFIDVLLSLKEREEDVGSSFTLGMGSVKDIFLGGADTSFTVLIWAMAELIWHPSLMKDVQDEIRSIVGSKEIITEEDINKLTLLKVVIKETLRLHIPGPLLVPRVASQSTQIHGYNIPKGTRVIINAWAIAKDPKHWDRPEEFWPQRFTNSNIDFRGQSFELIPFGAGRRLCPGISFGVALMECALANLLYHFNWEVPEEMREEILDMTESPGITVQKKSPLILIAKPYDSSLGPII